MSMRLRRLVEGVRHCRELALVVGIAACGNGTQGVTTPAPSIVPSANGNPGVSDSGSTPGSSSSGGQVSSGSEAESGAESEGDAAQSTSEAGDDASEGDAAPSCVKGQVTPDEVVMLGDSYLDAPWGDVGPTLMMQANATYRHYYIGGASMAWGNPDTQFYIPYQYDPMAKTDTSVTSPTDIKVVIMDGGGNDVLIGNTSCEQTAPPGNTSCVTTVQSAIDKAQSTMQQMAADGVKSIVFFFYPHLNPAGGGILTTPAPAINDTLDYAYPLAEQILLRLGVHVDPRQPHVLRTAHGRHDVRVRGYAAGVRGPPGRLHQERPGAPDARGRAGHLEPPLDGDAGPLHRAVTRRGVALAPECGLFAPRSGSGVPPFRGREQGAPACSGRCAPFPGCRHLRR